MSGREQEVSQSEVDVAGVQIDVYGIKVGLTPRPVKESKPESWAEVARRVNAHLMALAAGLIGLLDDTVSAARNLVGGVGHIPDAIARRVEKAHNESDSREELEQKKVRGGNWVRKEPALARKHLETLLNKHQLKGNYAGIKDLGGGRWLVTIVRPDVGELLTDLAGKALLQAGEVEDRKEDDF
jgi:hypothetical protein